MELYYPVKNPINQQNLFGAKEDFAASTGQLGHPGIDFECPMYTPVYAPCDGNAFYVTDKYGGCGIYIRTLDNAYNIILWHMVPAGTPGYPYSITASDFVLTPVKAGQLLGYSGDSGYPAESSGPHLHVGMMPLNSALTALNPTNGYMGCVNPLPFFNAKFAQDIPALEAVVATASTVVQDIATDTTDTPAQKISWLQQLSLWLQSIFGDY